MYIATSSFDVMRRVPHAVNGMDMKCRGLRRVVSVRRLLDDDLLVNELNPHVAFPRQLSDPTTTAQRVLLGQERWLELEESSSRL